mgnify:CR=1 FL=1
MYKVIVAALISALCLSVKSRAIPCTATGLPSWLALDASTGVLSSADPKAGCASLAGTTVATSGRFGAAPGMNQPTVAWSGTR